MKTTTRAALVVAVTLGSLLATAPLRGEDRPAPSAPEALARELMHVSGAGEMGKQMMVQMIPMLKQMQPDLPEDFWSEFVASVDPAEIEEFVVPVYVRNLTVEEMTAALEFYKSPAGQSLLRKMPQVMQESMAAGQAWGAELGERVAKKVIAYKKAHPET